MYWPQKTRKGAPTFSIIRSTASMWKACKLWASFLTSWWSLCKWYQRLLWSSRCSGPRKKTSRSNSRAKNGTKTSDQKASVTEGAVK
eukprot:CAMPEP_0174938950 /NCGR_PEP_ID=MMETSP1355-20121228/65091_1 /TAXON_ID=464990 /ORGANISM="Hemiselmis tepida, Strain CCMP443" /LENGTH=86 /DNA_ID=CAMNT_0016185923 /DNA_START=311 /DNA_END=571 /DNA_ORIENTATION=-